jgi:hypothetical protein
VFAAQYQAMYPVPGNNSGEVWAEHVETAAHLATEIYPIADSLVALQPEQGQTSNAFPESRVNDANAEHDTSSGSPGNS